MYIGVRRGGVFSSKSSSRKSATLQRAVAPLIEAMEQRMMLSASAPLTGTVIGTPGSYNNSGNTIAKVFDGNVNNYFDGPTSTGNYAGLDLGTAKVITQISFAPRPGYGSRMVGGIFQGSDSADFSGALTTLFTVTASPASGSLTTVNVSSAVPFRYVRYLSPNGSYGDVGEVKFTGFAPAQGATLGSDGTLAVYGSNNADTISLTLDPFHSTVSTVVDGTTTSFTYTAVKRVVVGALGGADAVTYTNDGDGTDAAIPASILSGDGADTVQIADPIASVFVDAGAGNDVVSFSGEGTGPTLYGGDGNDVIEGLEGTEISVTAYGDEGDDTLSLPEDTGGSLYGGAGNDHLLAADPSENILISGGDGTDTFQPYEFVGAGILKLDSKPDSSLGTSGQGTLQLDTDVENITIDGDQFSGGHQASTLSITGDSAANVITVNNAYQTSATINGGDGNDTISVGNGPFGEFGGEEAQPVVVNCGNGNNDVTVQAVQSTINGGSGNDSLGSYSGTVVINGGGGNNHLFAGGAFFDNATLNGGTGNDTITTVEGDFLDIIGGTGSNVIEVGGDNGGTEFEDVSPYSVTITGGSGADTITGGAYYATINGGSGNDSINYVAQNGLDIEAGNGNNNIQAASSHLLVNGGSGNDVIRDVSQSVFDNSYPSGALNGGAGNDTIYADKPEGDTGYPDTVDGGAGTDTAYIDPAYDTVTNVENINYYNPVNTPPSAALTGTVIGTPGSNNNSGNTIAKVFDGNVNNYFDGATANGNYAGLDLGTAKIITQISYAPRSGYASRMVGGIFQGSDSADFSGAVTTLYTVTGTPPNGALTTVNVSSAVPFRYVRYLSPNGSYGNVGEVKFNGYAPVQGATLSLDGTLTVYGTNSADTISVRLGDPSGGYSTTVEVGGDYYSFYPRVSHLIVAGLGGNDSIDVTFGTDPQAASSQPPSTLAGGDGNDNIHVTDPVAGTLLDGGGGNDTLQASENGIATLRGGDGDDLLLSAGATLLTLTDYGDNGNDTLELNEDTGGTMYGGAGNDVLIAAEPNANVVASGGDGTDTFEPGAAYGTAVFNLDGKADSYLYDSGPGRMQLNTDIENITVDSVNAGFVITGDSAANVITVNAEYGGATVNGGDGDDTISMTDVESDIVVNCGNGNNTVSVNIADGVTVNGGTGNDSILVAGDTGDYTARDPGNVVINGGGGNDTIGGFAVNATVTGGDGADLINYYGSSILNVDGGAGNDTIGGAGGTEHITGGADNDSIRGGDITKDQYTFVAATLAGGDGNDTIYGNDGVAETIDGGANTDTAYIDPTGDTVSNVETVIGGSTTPTPTVLTGTVIGTAGSYNNSGNTIAKVFDGNVNNFFDGPTANGDYAGLDLGTAKIITQISYAPRPGQGSRMVGGIFQGSDSADFSGALTTLYTVTASPASGSLTTVSVSSALPFRYVRYLSPNGSYGDVGEVKFTGYAPAQGATLSSDGTLAVYGSNSDDTISVTLDDESKTVSATVDGTTQTFTYASVKGIVIAGLGGDDNISEGYSIDFPASAPSSTIAGGDGSDVISEEDSDGSLTTPTVLIDAGAGDDRISIVGDGEATLHGGDGNDQIHAEGANQLYLLGYGDNGNDTIDFDLDAFGAMYGGAGDDSLNMYPPNGPETLSGGDGNDTFNMNLFGVSATVLRLDGQNDSTMDNSPFTLDADIENINVDEGQDVTIYGSAADNVISVAGTDGATVYAGAGNDTIYAQDHLPETIDGGPGTDTAYVDATGDTVTNVETVNKPAATGGSVSGRVTTSNNAGVAGATVYLDTNNNSVLDSGELSTKTLADGSFSFTGVAAGDYIVRQVIPAGQKQTSPASNYGIHITVANGSTLTGENFTDASTGTASIAGSVFNDANNNQKQDTGEAGLKSFTVYLDLNNTGSFAAGDPTAVTDANGNYTFASLAAGTYIVRVETPSGYSQTTPTQNYGQHETVATGQKVIGAVFGERKIG